MITQPGIHGSNARWGRSLRSQGLTGSLRVQVNVPAGYEMWRYYHILYFVGGTVGMMAMNWYWFTALVARARGMIKRVQSGRPPTSDYERAPAKKES